MIQGDLGGYIWIYCDILVYIGIYWVHLDLGDIL